MRAPAWPLTPGGVFASRYAGAMLLHAFGGQTGAGEILAAAARGDPADAALPVGGRHMPGAGPGHDGAVQAPGRRRCGAAGRAARAAGPADAAAQAGRDRRRHRPARAAAHVRGRDAGRRPVVSGVCYVDDHFVPAPAPAGREGVEQQAGPGGERPRGTHVTARDGRAVCFVTGEPSGLSVTLPKALKELKKAAGPGAKIILGFDHGGAYPQVFRHCREHQVHWATYRRAPLAVPAMLSAITTVTIAGRHREITWAGETVNIKDYGQARQITLFEHGRLVLQILTSDFDACPAEILDWLKSRWREENFLKYATENYGIDKICDYIAGIEANTKIIGNPARKKANQAVREAEKALAAAERDLAVLLADPAITPAAENTTLIPAAQQTITAARDKLTAAAAARSEIPAKLPANVINPEAETALLRTRRRGLQMVLRLLAHNAEHWLSGHLNAYLRDDDEYRAITRQTIIHGLAGTITYTPQAITVELQRPGAPRVARALVLPIDEISHTPPAMPGDQRPVTYRLAANPALLLQAHSPCRRSVPCLSTYRVLLTLTT